jgi:hypothetical protein
VIHYHGGPITPIAAAATFWPRRHGLCSFESHSQAPMMFELCQSVALDNGAFSKWKAGTGEVDVPAYAAWVREWERHPGFDFAIIPDVIDGSEFDNDKMISRWICGENMRCPSVPVWHLHESLGRLEYMTRAWPRVALGSSGAYSEPGSESWWERMSEVRDVVCDDTGRPKVKLHGLRMLNPTIFAHVPLASADSCNVAVNIGKDVRWSGTYQPVTQAQRALILAERIEMHASAARWSKRHGTQQNLELIG